MKGKTILFLIFFSRILYCNMTMSEVKDTYIYKLSESVWETVLYSSVLCIGISFLYFGLIGILLSLKGRSEKAFYRLYYKKYKSKEEISKKIEKSFIILIVFVITSKMRIYPIFQITIFLYFFKIWLEFLFSDISKEKLYSVIVPLFFILLLLGFGTSEVFSLK